MDEESRNVSLKLWDVLERVGVSERMRKLHRESSIRDEIMRTITCTITGMNMSSYKFGSSSEGTTTRGMESDDDLVECDERYLVIDDIQHATTGTCYLNVTGSHTRPGYSKLQIVENGTPLTVRNSVIADEFRYMHDCEGRVCIKHFSVVELEKHIRERSGPADTVSEPSGYFSMDWVLSFRSRTFPSAATESLMECMRSGWLTKDDVEKMITFGSLFVGVGHPSSAEKDIHVEWRVSFSLQERYLMFSLNATQHNCYVVLKFIKNMLTSKPDVGKSITSYHCKTCLFSVIIKTSSDQWVPDNLIDCTMICLTELRQCLHDGNLPNFFIKTNNMFERRVHGQIKERLIYHLNEIINERVRVFYNIKSDHIGEALSGHVDRYTDYFEWNLAERMHSLYKDVCVALSYYQTVIARFLCTVSEKDATLYLFQISCYLASVNTITEHTHEETMDAITFLEPVLHELYAQHLTSLAFSTETQQHRQHLMKASVRHLRQGRMWDHLISGRLVYVTILYSHGNIDMCCGLLERIEQNLTEAVYSVCGCYILEKYSNAHLLSPILRGVTDTRSIVQKYMATCMIFPPSHSEIIPKALQYEIHRSVATPPGSRECFDDDWLDLSVVDSKVYFYFMQYLVYSNQCKDRAKRIAMENLWIVLQKDKNLGHRETGYNLLGWIYIEEGRIQDAVCCFIQSWTIRPQHNAAKWHMLNLICQQCEAGRGSST